MDKEYYMKIALEEAKKASEKDEIPVGAIIVKDNQIIAYGHNTRENSIDPLGHAEIEVIKSACKKLDTWRLDGCDLYVTLEPCLMCAGVILQSRIKNVYYGARDPKAGVVESVLKIEDYKFCHQVYYEGGIMHEECSKIIKDFFSNIRERKKVIKKIGAPETNRTSDQ